MLCWFEKKKKRPKRMTPIAFLPPPAQRSALSAGSGIFPLPFVALWSSRDNLIHPTMAEGESDRAAANKNPPFSPSCRVTFVR